MMETKLTLHITKTGNICEDEIKNIRNNTDKIYKDDDIRLVLKNITKGTRNLYSERNEGSHVISAFGKRIYVYYNTF